MRSRRNVKISQDARRILFVVCSAAVIILLCLIVYLSGGKKQMLPEDYPLNVCFFDVGEGDCELIRCEDVNVLIDGGEAECGYRVEQYLKACGVETIDCYILTHPHSDHIGASAHVISTFSVARVMTTAFPEFNLPTVKVYDDMLEAVAATGAELLQVSGGETYTYGPLALEILSPVAESDDYNDMSVIVRAVYKNSSFLFMGDASSAVEEQILNTGKAVRSDVLKVGHHGAATSTSESFLKKVSPDYAVISCGADNSYGHPHPQTLNLLSKYDVNVFRTDLNGTVRFYGNGRKLQVRSAS